MRAPLSPVANVALIMLGYALCTLRDLVVAVAAVAAIITLTYTALDYVLPWLLSYAA